MTPCDTINQLMLLVESGEACADDGARVEAHLSSCPACRKARAEYRLLSTCGRALPVHPPVLDIAALEARARRPKAPVLRWTWLAAAALFLLLAGAAVRLRDAEAPETELNRTALLHEWQFWMVSAVGEEPGSEEGEDTSPRYASDWSERDFARHLLALEGLLPDEEVLEEEEPGEATTGGLPPISLRDCNIPALLRS